MAASPAQLPFVDVLLKSRLVSEAQLDDLFPDADDRQDANRMAEALVKAGLLTRYQVQMLQGGKYRGFFLGPYKVLRPIGQGGMGAVFLAEHTNLARRVAVKVLPPDKAKDKLSLERFHREARAAAALDHPNIVRLHDISQGNGVHFLVMEYAEGTDLQTLMGQTGPLHYAQAAQYIAQAAAGLQHAHEKGFIHRDIKPANLMLLKTGGGIKILDMGLARSFHNPSDNLTANLADGDIAGTVDYLSPEQALNMPLDERSDIYSLGATFYSLVAGHPPFKGTTAQKLMQHQLKDPPSVSVKLSGRVPQALSDVIGKMMAKKPSERFQTAADVIDALGPWLPVPTTGNIVTDPAMLTPMPASRTGMTKPFRNPTGGTGPLTPPKPVWKRPAVLAGAAVGLLLLVGGIVTAVALSGGGKKADTAGRPPAITPLPPVTAPPTNGPPPPTPPAAKVPYKKIEFAGLTPTSVRVGGGGKGEMLHALGVLRLPDGVIVNHFDGEAVGEYSIAEVNGATALGLRQTNRRDGVQVHFFSDGTLTRLPDGAKATLRVTYSLDGTGEGGTAYELTGEPYTKYAATKLPPTGGRWKAVDLAFTRPAGGKGYELIVNAGQSPTYADGTLYVRSVEVLPPDAPPVVTGAVYEFDAGKVAAFRRTGQTIEENGRPEATVARGWTTEVYDKAGRGDFAAERDGSGGAVGVGATGEKAAAQLAFRPHDLPADPLEAGKRYTAVLEYRTDRGTDGYTSVQTMDEWKTIGGATLTDTAGEWRTCSFAFTRPAGQKVQLTLGPRAANGGFLWVRRVYLTGDAPSAAAPGETGKRLYALDLTNQKVFTRTGGSEPTGDPAEDVRFVEKSRTGDGDLPAGWRGIPWDEAAEAAFVAEEKGGRMALGMKNVRTGGKSPNAFTGMLFAPRVTFAGPVRVRFTYLTDGDDPNGGQVKFKATAPVALTAKPVAGVEKLPGTAGRWVTKEFDLDPNGATEGYLEFHAFDASPTRGFYLSEVVITDPTARADAAAPQPASNLPAVPVVADFSAFKDGSYPTAHGGPVGADAVAALQATGWWASQYVDGDTGQLAVEADAGRPVVSLSNTAGKGSIQLYQPKPAGTLAGGRAYLLKFEYQAAEGTSGQLELREKDVANRKDCPFTFRLDSTAGKWESRTLEVEPAHDYPVVFVLQNHSTGVGNQLSVRKLEIVPVGGK